MLIKIDVHCNHYFTDKTPNFDANKKQDVGFQQYSALVNPKANNVTKPKPSAGPAGPRGRMLPAVPSPSPSPFKPIQSPVHQIGANANDSKGTGTPTYHTNNVTPNQYQFTQGDKTYLSEGNHNYVNFPSSEMQQHHPAYANIPIASGNSRPNSTTSFAEIQQAKQKQQQLEQQRRRESTGSGRFLVENTTSSRLVSNAMSEMIQNHTVNASSHQARHRSASQASLASSSATTTSTFDIIFNICFC